MSNNTHNCNTEDKKLPIDRPCSACSAGDFEMKYHSHCPPFRNEQFTGTTINDLQNKVDKALDKSI